MTIVDAIRKTIAARTLAIDIQRAAMRANEKSPTEATGMALARANRRVMAIDLALVELKR